MSRYARKVDTTHAAVVKALRAVGCSVQSLASVGKGCPDLLVGWGGRTFLFEVKSPEAIKKDGTVGLSHRITAEDQARWQANWRGSFVVTVTGPDDALKRMGLA